MAKRNQYNKSSFSTPVATNVEWTCTDMRFGGSINTATATRIWPDVVLDGTTVIVSASAFTGSSAGTVIMTNVTLNPGEQFQVRILNPDILASQGWMAFTQLSGPTGSYSNLAALPNNEVLRMRVASQTDTIAPGDPVALSYFLVRSLDG